MRNVTVNSIGEYIREQREQAKISMRQLAQSAGVSNPYLSQIERGLRKPSADILQQIAKGLRISAEALYVQAGILEDRPADSGVRSALLADPQLSERQKQVLMEIYESFRRENAAAAEGAEGEPWTTTTLAELAPGSPGAEADTLEAAAMEAAAAMEESGGRSGSCAGDRSADRNLVQTRQCLRLGSVISVLGAYTPLRDFFLALGLAAFIVEAWAFIDAITRPGQAFVATGKQTKQLWLIILGVAAVVGLAGAVYGVGPTSILPVAAFVAAAIYLADVRPKVKDFPKNGGSSSGPYGPW